MLWRNRFVRYGIVGIANTAVDVLLFVVLVKLAIPVWLAATFSYMLGVANSYYWNSRIVFAKRGQMWRFGWVSLFTLLVNVGIVRYAPVVVGSIVLVKLVATGVSAVVGYALNKTWAFGFA